MVGQALLLHHLGERRAVLPREVRDELCVVPDHHRVACVAELFHAHFRAVTAMSPLQFQKQLRLQEARRLMLSEDLDAAEAGHRVGYDDPSHFSREYKRHFG